MDTRSQIQGIKAQIENIKSQIESIEVKNKNTLLMMDPIGDLLLNLGIQMFNTGLQAINMGNNLSSNTNKFYPQIKKVSEQINNILNSYQTKIQTMMLQQKQTMNQMLQKKLMEKKSKINLIIESNHCEKIGMIVEPDITFEEIYYQFLERIGKKYLKIYFLCNSHKIKKNDQRKLTEISTGNNISITVVDY